MLHLLEIENFLSIRDRQYVDLRVLAGAPAEPDRLVPIFQGAKMRAPRIVAFFGANGAGKSTVLKALNFVIWFARESFQWQPTQQLPMAAFGDSEAQNEPSRFALEFAASQHLGDDLQGIADSIYRYELEIKSANEVLREILICKPSGARKPFTVFSRVGNQVKASTKFGLGPHYPYIDKVLRPNASLISTLAQLDHPYARALQGLSINVHSNIGMFKWEATDETMIPYYKQESELVDFFNREIGRLDIGITGFSIVDAPNGQPMVQFEHEGLSYPVPSYFESHGTRQFFRIFPIIGRSLLHGGIAIVDEIDTSIHPALLREIVGWFFDEKRNRHGAQLWLTAQSPSLLEDLLKEEIYFCEKSRKGRTNIFSLRDISGVRRIDNYYRKYLGGVYGAVPHVG